MFKKNYVAFFKISSYALVFFLLAFFLIRFPVDTESLILGRLSTMVNRDQNFLTQVQSSCGEVTLKDSAEKNRVSMMLMSFFKSYLQKTDKVCTFDVAYRRNNRLFLDRFLVSIKVNVADGASTILSSFALDQPRPLVFLPIICAVLLLMIGSSVISGFALLVAFLFFIFGFNLFEFIDMLGYQSVAIVKNFWPLLVVLGLALLPQFNLAEIYHLKLHPKFWSAKQGFLIGFAALFIYLIQSHRMLRSDFSSFFFFLGALVFLGIIRSGYQPARPDSQERPTLRDQLFTISKLIVIFFVWFACMGCLKRIGLIELIDSIFSSRSAMGFFLKGMARGFLLGEVALVGFTNQDPTMTRFHHSILFDGTMAGIFLSFVSITNVLPRYYAKLRLNDWLRYRLRTIWQPLAVALICYLALTVHKSRFFAYANFFYLILLLAVREMAKTSWRLPFHTEFQKQEN